METNIIDNYDIDKMIGQGGFGKVYKARRKSDGKVIALKVIDISKGDEGSLELTKAEVEYLKTLSFPECNPFVICYYDSKYDETNKKFFVEMELIEGKTMNQYFTDLWAEGKSTDVIYYYLLLAALDIAKGLQYTHAKGIIHNDFKLDNVMIDTNNVPRIIDYGLACSTINKQNMFCVGGGGTPDYLTPEFIMTEKRYPSSDMWALGISLYIAATKGQYPYNVGVSIMDVYDALEYDEPKRLNISNNQLNDLVNGLLVKDPTKRLTADQVIFMLKSIERPKSLSDRQPLPENNRPENNRPENNKPENNKPENNRPENNKPENNGTGVKTSVGSFEFMTPAQMSSFLML